MKIREMTLSDVPQVAELERRIFSRPWSETSLANALRDDNAVFLVALERAENTCGGEAESVAGYIGMYVSPPEGEIANVAVAEELRGSGCGTRLLEAIQEAARRRQMERIFLEVRFSNAPAIHLYRKMGFTEIGMRKNFYELPREDAMLMRWDRNRLC